jgi:chromosome segregation ATPase
VARFFILSLLILAGAPARSQDPSAAEQRVEALRQQLRDIMEKQAQLQARVQQLDEALRPENIERSVAGTGTTDAAALRERRRQQLEREKAVVDGQLQSLDASRGRLEATIASAEAEAVRLRASALGANSPPAQVNATPIPGPAVSSSTGEQKRQRVVRRRKRGRAHRRGTSR